MIVMEAGVINGHHNNEDVKFDCGEQVWHMNVTLCLNAAKMLLAIKAEYYSGSSRPANQLSCKITIKAFAWANLGTLVQFTHS